MAAPAWAANEHDGDDDVVAAWLLNNNGGVPILTDSSDQSHTLTNPDAHVVSDTDNKQEGDASAEFDGGVGNYLYVADAATLPCPTGGATDFTYTLWFKMINESKNWPVVLNKGDQGGSGNTSFCLRINANDDVLFQIGDGGGSTESVVVEAAIDGAEWHFAGFSYVLSTKAWVAVLWDDNASSYLVDTSGTATNQTPAGAWPVTIGCDDDGGNPWYGYIDEVILWKRALTQAELKDVREQDYAAPSSGTSSKRHGPGQGIGKGIYSEGVRNHEKGIDDIVDSFVWCL